MPAPPTNGFGSVTPTTTCTHGTATRSQVQLALSMANTVHSAPGSRAAALCIGA